MRSSAAFTIGIGDKRTVRLLGAPNLPPVAKATIGGNQARRTQRPIRPVTLVQVHASVPAIKDSSVEVGTPGPMRLGVPPQTPANVRDEADRTRGPTELLAPRRTPTSARVITSGSVLGGTPVPTRAEVIPPVPTGPRTNNKNDREFRTRRPTAMETPPAPTIRKSGTHRLLQLHLLFSVDSAESAVPSGLQSCALSSFSVCLPQ